MDNNGKTGSDIEATGPLLPCTSVEHYVVLYFSV